MPGGAGYPANDKRPIHDVYPVGPLPVPHIRMPPRDQLTQHLWAGDTTPPSVQLRLRTSDRCETSKSVRQRIGVDAPRRPFFPGQHRDKRENEP
jgi:hypothetical protein